MAGLMTGAIIGGLVTASMDMFFYSMMSLYLNKMIVVIDAGDMPGTVPGMGGK